MQYIAATISLIVALVGVHGNTWNPGAKGWRRLTRTGWITGICALLAFTLALAAEMARKGEERKAHEQRQTINAIARMELCLAAGHLKVGLDVLHSLATGRTTSDGADLGFALKTLGSPEALQALEQLDLLKERPARPGVGDARTLDDFVSVYSRRFVDQTNMTLAKYSTFLEGTLILKSTWLVNHNFVRRLTVTSEQVAQVRAAHGAKYPGLWRYERDDYLEVLQLLGDILALTHASNEGLACEKPQMFRDAKKQ